MKRQELEQARKNILSNEKDNGRFGKAYEIDVKLYLNGKVNTRTAVASNGKIDCSSKGKSYEIKSRCGEVENIKAKYVIYNPTPSADYNENINNSYVLTTNDFINVLKACNLYTIKKSTSGYNRHVIQTFYNSKSKNALFLGMLSNYTKLTEWQ